MISLPLSCHGKSSSEISTELPAFIMGILNVTVDSFWEGSRFSESQAVDAALQMLQDGADIIDIGAESTRPGSQYVCCEHEIEKIIPVVEKIRCYSDCPISVDTRKKKVLEAAHKAGADILNDVSALEDDCTIAEYVANKNLAVILMHKRGIPAIMQEDCSYANPFGSINSYLCERVAYALEMGIAPEKILVDPGIGFGKDLPANIDLVRNCGSLCGGLYPVVMGLSRKTFIGEMTGCSVKDRCGGTLAANLLAVQYGAKILRVHDVKETRNMLCVLENLGCDSV